MIDAVAAKSPEHDECLFRRKFFVLSIVCERVFQNAGLLGARELFKGLDTRVEPHLLRELVQPSLGFLGGKATAALVHGNIELQNAVRPDLQSVPCEFVADFEVVSQAVLAAQLTGFTGLFMIFGVAGEIPFLECFRQCVSHRKRKDTVSNTLGIGLHGLAGRAPMPEKLEVSSKLR